MNDKKDYTIGNASSVSDNKLITRTGYANTTLRVGKNDVSWLKEYLKNQPDVCRKGIDGVYDVLPYKNIEILIDRANRDDRGLLYVMYGVEVHLEQQMNWLQRLYGGVVDGDEGAENKGRFGSIRDSIDVYTDFLSWVVMRGCTGGFPLR